MTSMASRLASVLSMSALVQGAYLCNPLRWLFAPQEYELKMPNGDVRTYRLRFPKGYDPQGPHRDHGLPVVFDFHGAGSNSREQSCLSDLGDFADRDNVMLVYPQSKDRAWHGTLYMPEDTNDVDFIQALVEHLRKEYLITSLFSMGMSSGGDMTSTLACLPNSPFSGFGAVTYAYYWGNASNGTAYLGHDIDAPPPSLVTGKPTKFNCAHGESRPFIYFHGTKDTVCPYEGSGAPWYDPQREEVAHRWGRHNGCSGDWIAEQVAPRFTRYTWEGCRARTEFYKMEDYGHTWPKASNGANVDTSDVLWKFFGLDACPLGSLAKCVGSCPNSPAIYESCHLDCTQRCPLV